MVPENSPIIADDLDRPWASRIARIVFVAAVIVGGAAALHYARLGLTLSHYDARSHLVVARRVVDSLTPGWRQLGAVWLPLPHLLNLIPVQLDWNFRTGFSAVVLSIAAFAWGLSALSRYLSRHAGSMAVSAIVPLVLLANPNILYLQSTPLTEPILFGLSLVSLLAVDTWVARARPRDAQRAGILLALLVLTRYEGWPIAAALAFVAWRAARPPRTGAACLLIYPAVAAVVFLALSYFSSGVLLVTSGFFTPDNPARGAWSAAFQQVYTNTKSLGGQWIVFAGGAGALVALGRAFRNGGRSLLPLALFGAAILPLTAFHAGHPERVRYMVALVVAAGATAGLAFAVVPRIARAIAAGVFAAACIVTLPPFAHDAAMVTEAQWEVPFSAGRRAVTAYLQQNYDGTPILGSMSSLAHYMQETIAIGLPLRAFLHEGNGDLWAGALDSPRHYVRWIVIEEQALGGDVLARRARADPAFLDGFRRVAEGGGVALYRRMHP